MPRHLACSALPLLSPLLLCACSQQIVYHVNQDEGFLVVARHERVQQDGPETIHQVLRTEVTHSDADGVFTLNVPSMGLFSGAPASWLLLSKPGYQAWIGYADGENEASLARHDGNGFLLDPSDSALAEVLALSAVRAALDGICETVEPTDCQQIQAHVAARQAWLDKNWPGWTLPGAERSTTLHPFQVRVASWAAAAGDGARVLAAAALPDDAVAVLDLDNSGQRRLSILGPDGAQRVQVALAPGGAAPILVRDGTAGLWTWENGALQRFDLDGARQGTINLSPALNAGDTPTSLALLPAGFLLGIERDPGSPQLRWYDAEGRRLAERALPSIKTLLRTFPAADGAVFVHGMFHGGYDFDTRVGGMKKEDVRPRGVLRLSSSEAAPEVLLRGVDTVIPDEDGFWAYARDLYPPPGPDGRPTAGQAASVQLMQHLSWEGRCTRTLDVSDDRLGRIDLTGGQALDQRLVFFTADSAIQIGVDLVELDLGRFGPR